MRNSIQASITPAIRDVANERERQIIVEGFDEARDDGYLNGELAAAAACFALASLDHRPQPWQKSDTERVLWIKDLWPFEYDWFRVGDQRRELVKAAALLIAEIERIDRAAEKGRT